MFTDMQYREPLQNFGHFLYLQFTAKQMQLFCSKCELQISNAIFFVAIAFTFRANVIFFVTLQFTFRANLIFFRANVIFFVTPQFTFRANASRVVMNAGTITILE
jgi:hypothetical protein